ncbi:MAG: hypothetical protein LQ348_000516 [Seirophora lacunosa]|nr:MAG: hypothetical protein LQ344_000676 [Seirophora lacunosa]KAI4207668.1 MAG: hypothetical protein LQ348_000516 [Seirophora lacunosa]
MLVPQRDRDRLVQQLQVPQHRPTASLNTFCFNNRGHERFVKLNSDDVLRFNKHRRNLEERLITTDVTKKAVDDACNQICWAEFGIPIMLPRNPGHSVIGSRAQEWDSFLDVRDAYTDFEDGLTGLGVGIVNDKGGVDHNLTGHYSPKGYYNTKGYGAKSQLDVLPGTS